MKKAQIIVVIIVIIFVGSLFMKKKDEQYVEGLPVSEHSKKPHLATENFITSHLLDRDGTIRTDFTSQGRGEEALSESLGLWMEYLVEKGDNEQFGRALKTLSDLFILDNHLIAWEIKADGRATTNALIDDLRIIEALFRMGKKGYEEVYIQTAKEIAEALLTYNRQGDEFVDFYDNEYGYANEMITLSYLIPDAFSFMVEYGLFEKRKWEKLQAWMKEIPLKDGFYPKSYHVSENKFEFEEEVNVIDQLYTAIHLERIGASTAPLYEWLKAKFYDEGLLYGRYDRLSKEAIVRYEAPAVYALTIIYSLERADHSFAHDLYERMIMMRVHDEQSNYFGGYVVGDMTHSFDNLLPLLAEQRLRNEQIIH